jgi:transposase, IS30 family
VTPELDTIIGRHHRQATISLVVRKSKNTLLAKVKRNTAEAVARAITGSLAPHTEKVHTLTADNGREFARHQVIGKRLDARFYFAPPYHSWERGLKENTNGLVRQYFPKKSDFSKVGAADLRRVMQWLNHRPRKTLNFRTPHQVFFKTEEIVFTT